MRIAFIVYDYSKFGGIERYVRILAKAFAKNNNIYIFTSTPSHQDEDSVMFCPITLPPGPFFFRLALFSRKVVGKISQMHFDIIHNQGADGLIQDIITAHSCHRAWVEYSRKVSTGEMLKKTLNPLHTVILKNERHNFTKGNYKKIIAVSEQVKQEIIQYYAIPEDDIIIISPGVDINEFHPNNKIVWRDKIRKENNLSDEDFVILLVANEFRRKGLSVLLSALAKINNKNVRLMIVGKGKRFPYILAAKRLGISKRVVFIPSTEFVNRYYAAADLFVLPTRYEPVGLAIMEAMASGLPVIVSKIAGAAKLISVPECLLENPTDVNELVRKITYFINSKDLCNKLGITFHEIAKRYTWDKVAEKTFSVYESCMSNPRHS